MSVLHIIDNGVLHTEILARGGEVCAVYKNGQNYIWNGNAHYWNAYAPNLFPYIGRLTNQTYYVNGKPFQMEIHGFLKDKELVLERQTADSITFMLEADANTLIQYPFDFIYRVQYDITGATLRTTYTVENRSDGTMYFGIGGHPGFRVPLERGMAFEDYFLAFDEPCRPERILFSDQLLVAGTEAYPLHDQLFVPLQHQLFHHDAIVLKNTAKAVSLKSKRGTRSVTVAYPDFPYLGLWHTPGTDAPFLCIEPWSSLPSRDGIIEEITNQKDLIQLAQGDVYQNVWSITFN